MGRAGWIVVVAAAAAVATAAVFGPVSVRPQRAAVDDAATPLIRTDYSDPGAWLTVRALIGRPTADGFLARLEIIDDRAWAGLEPSQAVRRLSPPHGDHALVVMADARTMRDPEHTLLCVDPSTLRSVRVIPSELWSIENNLSLANLDWNDFLDAADKDGVLRGFKDAARK